MAYTLEQAKRFKQIHELLWREMAKLYDLYALRWTIGNLKCKAIVSLEQKGLLTKEETRALLRTCACVGCLVSEGCSCICCPIKWHTVKKVDGAYQIAEHDSNPYLSCTGSEDTAYYILSRTNEKTDKENYEFLCTLIADSFMD